MALTKTSFMRGMQCPKMLWLDKHHPELQVIPPHIQKRLDEGNDFGDKAMGMFGPYEEMTVYRKGTTIPDTKSYDRAYCGCDIKTGGRDMRGSIQQL